jgi:hypothetical protein
MVQEVFFMKFSTFKVSLTQLLFFAGFGLTAACGAVDKISGKDDDEPAGEPAELQAFLGPAHFDRNYLGLVEVSRSELVGTIESSSTFMLTPPETESESEMDDASVDNEPCYIVEDRIEVIDSHNIKLRYRLDTTQCEQEIVDPSTGISREVQLRAYGEHSCSTSNLESFASRRASDWIFEKLCENDPIQTKFVNMEQTETLRQGSQERIKISHQAIMSSDGQPCREERQGGGISIDNCGQYSTLTFGEPNNKRVILLQKLVARDLQGNLGRDYFHAGTYEFTLNHWQGEFTYGAFGVTNGDQAPTYEFQNASSQQSLNGIYRFLPDGEELPEEQEQAEE